MNVSLSLGIPVLRVRDSDQESIRVSLAKRGERAAFDELVLTYTDDLRGFLRRRVREHYLDDLVQDTWLAAWNALTSFDSKSRFKTWLFAIAMNKTRDHYRQVRTLAAFPDLEDQQGTEDLGERTVIKELVQEALQHLTESQREVLELYYFAGFTLPEVAQTVGRNLNTVKYQFYRGHVELGTYLEISDGAPTAKKGNRS